MNVLVRALCIAWAFEAVGAVAAEGAAKPNIIVVLIDDLGWADLGCYGADLHETPHLDRFAKSGVRFTSAYASAPVCSPTRAALLTGRHPARLNMTIWRESTQAPPRDRQLIPPIVNADLPHTEHTLAELLKEQGYLTAHVGKWHLGDLDYFPETQGFDIHIGGNHWGAPATHFFPYRGPSSNEFRYVPHMEWGRAGEYLTDRLTDEAVRIMERAGDQPFLLNLWHYAVHTPLEAPADEVQDFEQKRRPAYQHQNATYAAMVKRMDASVGRILAKLDELKIADRTAVIFTSDNGGYLAVRNGTAVTSNHPLCSGKGSLYEGGIRVPLIVRWPGVTPKGAVCDVPVVSADLYPTIRALTSGSNADVPAGPLDGISLAGLLREPARGLERETLYWHYPHYYPTTTPVSAIRSGDWKLLEYYEDQHVELYDLSQDLGESQDLAAKHPERAEQLRKQLGAWKTEVGAKLPEVNPHVP